MPALNKQYRANGCGIHTCQLLEEGEKAKGKNPRYSSRPLHGLFLCAVKLALVQQSLIFLTVASLLGQLHLQWPLSVSICKHHLA